MLADLLLMYYFVYTASQIYGVWGVCYLGVMLAIFSLVYLFLYTSLKNPCAARLNIKLLDSIFERLVVIMSLFLQMGAGSWGSFTPSVCGSEIGAKEARCLDGACVKFDISLLSLWFSHSNKLSNIG